MNRVWKNLVLACSTFFVASLSFAQEAAAAPAAANSNFGWYALAAGIAVGLAVIGGAFGQGKAASAALEGIARNPGAADKIFVPMILGMALIESLVIFAWVMAFFLYGKIG